MGFLSLGLEVIYGGILDKVQAKQINGVGLRRAAEVTIGLARIAVTQTVGSWAAPIRTF